MTSAEYPRERVESLIRKTKLQPCHRIMGCEHLSNPLGTANGDSRFCAATDSYTVLYAAPDFITAFVETVVRDRFVQTGPRDIFLKEITERGWARIETKGQARFRLLDLRRDGCMRLGAPTDAVNARNHAAGRALGRTIHAGHRTVDGFLFSSRLTGGDACAIYDRALRKLEVSASGLLAEHPDLPGILSRYDIRLVAT